MPDIDEIGRCSSHLAVEVQILRPTLVLPVGKLAIAQLMPEMDQLVDAVGKRHRVSWHGHTTDVIALPHPSGASTWHRMEPGKSLLTAALREISSHPAWRGITASIGGAV